jgi:hypothetical protein
MSTIKNEGKFFSDDAQLLAVPLAPWGERERQTVALRLFPPLLSALPNTNRLEAVVFWRYHVAFRLLASFLDASKG